LSYTWRKYNAKIQQLAAEAGYRYAFSGRHEPVRSDVNSFAVPRMNLSKGYNLDDFQAIAYGDWDYLGLVQKLKGL
jgi:hypothetical protein